MNTILTRSSRWFTLIGTASVLSFSSVDCVQAQDDDAATKHSDYADWEARYQQYLEENPRIKAAVESGTITKEQVIAGLKSRADESEQPVDDDLEAQYQQLLKERPELVEAIKNGRLTKERIMARLNAGADRARGQEAALLSHEQKNLARNAGTFDFTAKIDLGAIGSPGVVINTEGKSQGQMILENNYLIMQGKDKLGESLSINGWREDTKDYFSFSFESARTPFGFVQGIMANTNTLVMKDPSGMVVVTTTFDEAGGSKAQVLIGPGEALLLTVANTPVRRRAEDILQGIMASPVTPAEVNRSSGSKDPAENFAAEHLELQRFAGDFLETDSRSTVTSRMVCLGRFLFNVSTNGRQITDISVVGFDNARKIYQMALFESGSTVPRYFEGGADGKGGFQLKDPFDPQAKFVVTPGKNGGYSATFSSGTEGGARTLSFTPRTEEKARPRR